VVFDRNVGDPDAFPGELEGMSACEASGLDVPEGRHGAGTGCTIAKLGASTPLPGGQGTASTLLHDTLGGHRVGAIMVVNAAGSIRDDDTQVNREAWYAADTSFRTSPLANTTIGVVATSAPLGRDGATRVAAMAHDGLARALDPVHTPFDGDAIFVLSTAPADLAPVDAATIAAIGAAGAHVTELAIRRGVAIGQRGATRP
jgi:L-aminopeptidase/D-esterase-like protein